MDSIAVFGVGSTNCRYAAASPDGTFLTEVSVESTRPNELKTQLCDAVADLRAATTRSLEAVAVSTTGLVEKGSGVIRDLDTPSGDVVPRIDLEAAIKEEHDLPLYLENDCTASALGEWYYGARDDQDCLVHLTIGTGIGGGVVERGRPVRGEWGQAGEFGHIPVAPEHDLTSTGVRGAWEAFCSGRGIQQYAEYRLKTDGGASRQTDGSTGTTEWDDGLSAPEIFAKAANGDSFAQECLDHVSHYNAAGVATVCNAVNPGLITVGGSVALQNPDVILDGIDAHLDDYLFVDRPSIRITPLGDDIGLYGALTAVPGGADDVESESLPSSPDRER